MRMLYALSSKISHFNSSLMFSSLKITCLNMKSFKTANTAYFILCMRPFSSLDINNLTFRSSILNKCKLKFSYIPRNFLRTGLNWKKCATTKIMSKYAYKKNRFRSLQSIETLTRRGQLQAATAFRETKRKVAEKMEKLKENVLTIPNALCVARIAAAPFLGYLILQEFYAVSLGIFFFAGITDVVDGYIARTYPSQQTMLGSFLDPAADKVLIATLFLCLTVNGLIPIPLTTLIIARDACLMGAGFYIRYLSLPPPKTLRRYFDVSLATAKLSPTSISKANTLIQLSLAAFSLAAPVYGYVDHFLLETLWYIVGTSTVLSGASYAYYNKGTYKFLTHKKKEKKPFEKEL